MKIIQTYVVLVFLTIAFSCVSFADNKEPLLNLSLKNSTLESVKEDLHNQTGYTVYFQEKWKDLPLKGKYKQVTLSEFFQRSLRGHNFTLDFNETERQVYVRFFGDKAMVWSKVNTVSQGGNQSLRINSGKASDPRFDFSEDELVALHERQRKDEQFAREDPSYVNPLVGMSNAELKELHSEQQKNVADRKNSDDAVTGLTAEESKEMRDYQSQQVEYSANNPNAVDSLTGLANKDLSALHEQQRLSEEKVRNDPNYRDPLTGLTNAELWKIQEQHGQK